MLTFEERLSKLEDTVKNLEEQNQQLENRNQKIEEENRDLKTEVKQMKEIVILAKFQTSVVYKYGDENKIRNFQPYILR